MKDKGHSVNAETYALHRNFAKGATSTLRKTAKLFRLAGHAYQVSPERRKQHIHPRHRRAYA